MSMNGTYKIYKDGKLVAEKKNKLTVLGRASALKAMLGQNQYFANVFGIGVSDQENSPGVSFLTDVDLGFSVGLYPISMGTLGQDDTNTVDGLVYIARITDTTRYNINEIGLFSMINTNPIMVDDLTIFNFESGDSLKETVSDNIYYIDNADPAYTDGKVVTILSDNINYRIGSNAVKMTGNSKKIFFDDVTTDLSNVEYSDNFVLAAYSSDPTTKNVTVDFYSDPSISATYTYSLNNGYNTIALQKNAGVHYDTVDWSKITKIEITTPSDIANTKTAASTTSFISIGSPAVVTWNSHGFSDGDPISFTTTGSLPTGLTASKTYYIINSSTNTFNLSATSGGALIVTSGTQSGTHTASASSYIILDGLRIKQNKPIDAIEGLVSRAVLTTPIEKDSGSIIDIQYVLSMDLET